MAITHDDLEAIMAPLIRRIMTLEERLETESTQREATLFEVVDDLAQIENPPNKSLAFNLGDNSFYVFTSAGGWEGV